MTEEKSTRSNSPPRSMASLPYIKGVSEKLSRVLKKHDIRASFRPMHTLRKALVHPKDKPEKIDTMGVVYDIPCKDCDSHYIGETERKFSVRKKEHEAAIRLNQPDKSAIAEHALTEKHSIDFDNYKFIDTQHSFWPRKFSESMAIRKAKTEQSNLMNRDEGIHIPNIFQHCLGIK